MGGLFRDPEGGPNFGVGFAITDSFGDGTQSRRKVPHGRLKQPVCLIFGGYPTSGPGGGVGGFLNRGGRFASRAALVGLFKFVAVVLEMADLALVEIPQGILDCPGGIGLKRALFGIVKTSGFGKRFLGRHFDFSERQTGNVVESSCDGSGEGKQRGNLLVHILDKLRGFFDTRNRA